MPPQSSPFLSTVLNSAPSSPSTTPKRNLQPNNNTNTNSPSSSSATPTTAFPPSLQSLQARNKDYENPAHQSSSSNADPFGSSRRENNRQLSTEPYELRKQRAEATIILESVEMLIWFSMARNESISQTRKYYQDIVLGLSTPDSVVWQEEYEVPLEQRTPPAYIIMGGGGGGQGGGGMGSPARSGKGKDKVKRRS